MSKNDRPLGAISDDERLELGRIYTTKTAGCKGGIYIVRNIDGAMAIPQPNCGLYFEWNEHMGFYFRNYWFAYAYSLRLKAKNETAKS